jgi:hypothetical protein
MFAGSGVDPAIDTAPAFFWTGLSRRQTQTAMAGPEIPEAHTGFFK